MPNPIQDPIQEDTLDAIYALRTAGVVIAFADDMVQIRLASSDMLPDDFPDNVALTPEEAILRLAGTNPNWAAKYN